MKNIYLWKLITTIFNKKEKNEKVKLSSNYDEIMGLLNSFTRKTDRSSKLPFLNVFDHAVFHYLHSLSRFVLLVFQPYRIARYSWILTVKSLKFLGVCRDQSFDCVLPFARAWKEFWSTTLRFSQEPQRTFRLVYKEFQSWRTRDHSRSSRWNSRGNKQDDRGLFNWKEGRWNLRIKAVLGF